MKMLTRRGVLVEDMGQTYLAEPHADGEEARTLRPLQAAAISGWRHWCRGRGCTSSGSTAFWLLMRSCARKIIAAILERPVIEKILTHLGLDPQPPPKGRAREAGQD